MVCPPALTIRIISNEWKFILEGKYSKSFFFETAKIILIKNSIMGSIVKVEIKKKLKYIFQELTYSNLIGELEIIS